MKIALCIEFPWSKFMDYKCFDLRFELAQDDEAGEEVDTALFARLGGQPPTLNPQLSALNPQPSTLNSQPSTLDILSSLLHSSLELSDAKVYGP